MGFLDFQQDALRSPLQPLWYPPSSWKQLRVEYDRQLIGDARFAARGPAAAAVLAAYAQQPDADRLMKKALEAGSEVPAALAAKAQLLLARGAYAEAYRHAELVLSSGQDLTLLYALKGRCLAEMGRGQESTAEFKKATDEPHQVSAVHRLMAEAKRKQGDNQGAREQYKEVLRMVPDDIGARRALLELRQGG